MRVVFVPPRPLGLTLGGLEMQLIETERSLAPLDVHVVHYDAFSADLFRQIDIVHFFGTDVAHTTLARLLEAHRIPYVVSPVYNEDLRAAYTNRAKCLLPGTARRLLKRFLASAAALLPNSLAEGRLIQLAWDLPNAKIVPITNGVGAREASVGGQFYQGLLGSRLETRRRFILCVARLEPNKRIIELIDAVLQIGAFLVVIGRDGPFDAAYGNRIRRIVDSHPRNLLHVESVSSDVLASAYTDAWVHALVSRVETTGLVSLEAAARGANIVVGECPAVREYFHDIAWFCRASRPHTVTAALQGALGAPRNAHGQREVVLQRHSWTRAAQQTVAAYRSVIAPTHGAS